MAGDFAQLRQALLDFRDRRDWQRFHTPRALCASVAIEAAELLELTQWKTDDAFTAWARDNRGVVAAECADILCYLVLLADALEIDLPAAVAAKIAVNESRFPPAGPV